MEKKKLIFESDDDDFWPQGKQIAWNVIFVWFMTINRNLISFLEIFFSNLCMFSCFQEGEGVYDREESDVSMPKKVKKTTNGIWELNFFSSPI